ncbi:MAG: phospho-sugar mutase [Myxococcota bacterium]|nr:phospho-sugar mutase [Myxococcota bacterium]
MQLDVVKTWIERDPDPLTRQELEELIATEKHEELERRFASRLAFGTAGLRGVLGAGPTRMNQLVVRETTAGLGEYLVRTVPGAMERGVVIGFDGRHGSTTFAHDATCVLSALGFRVHLANQTLSTPTVAYAVRYFGAAAGIMITASHNPPEYNGYKVYWGNGAQIIPPHDHGIASAIDEAASREIPFMTLKQARDEKLVHMFGPRLLSHYLSEVIKSNAYPRAPGVSKLTIVYTPMHGVGAEAAERALQMAGFTNVHTVPSQREPDGDFPTVRFPNPEEPGAMDLAMALGQEVQADLIFANDPDADRLAVAVPNGSGGFQMLTGNEIGVLLGTDLINAHCKNAVVGTTIVSSRLLSQIAAAHDVDYFETLTGFKWIANRAITETIAGKQFLMGYEEALGYTVGNLVRDKDGISALVAFALHAARLHDEGESILGLLENIYRKYGLYVTEQKSLALDPNAKGPSIGDQLRANMPTSIAGRPITSITDIQTGTKTDIQSGTVSKLDLPKSDVLSFILDDDTRVIVRPSGTEPKVKCYYEIIEKFPDDSRYKDICSQAHDKLSALIEAHQAELASLK